MTLNDERSEQWRVPANVVAYTAVIRELSATPAIDPDGIVIDDSRVPWISFAPSCDPSSR